MSSVQALPVVRQKQNERVLDYLQKARQQGAEAVVSGDEEEAPGKPEVFYVKPTVLAGAPDNVAACESGVQSFFAACRCVFRSIHTLNRWLALDAPPPSSERNWQTLSIALVIKCLILKQTETKGTLHESLAILRV